MLKSLALLVLKFFLSISLLKTSGPASPLWLLVAPLPPPDNLIIRCSLLIISKCLVHRLDFSLFLFYGFGHLVLLLHHDLSDVLYGNINFDACEGAQILSHANVKLLKILSMKDQFGSSHVMVTVKGMLLCLFLFYFIFLSEVKGMFYLPHDSGIWWIWDFGLASWHNWLEFECQ